MRQRTQFQSRLYRYSLRKLRRSCNAADQQLIQLALLDPTIFAMAYEQTMEDLSRMQTLSFGFKISRAVDGTPIVDNLLKLLDWFIQNGPSLLEIIAMIAELFGGIASTSSILREESQDEELGKVDSK